MLVIDSNKNSEKLWNSIDKINLDGINLWWVIGVYGTEVLDEINQKENLLLIKFKHSFHKHFHIILRLIW